MLLKLKDGKIDGRFPDAEDRSLGSCPICSKPVVEHENIQLQRKKCRLFIRSVQGVSKDSVAGEDYSFGSHR